MGLFDAISGRNYKMNKIMEVLFSEGENRAKNLDPSEEKRFLIYTFDFSYNLISELFNPKYHLLNSEIRKLNLDKVRELNTAIALWSIVSNARHDLKGEIEKMNKKRLFSGMEIVFGITKEDLDSLISVMDLLATDKLPSHLIHPDYEQELELLGTQILNCIDYNKSYFNAPLFREIVLKIYIKNFVSGEYK